MKKLFAITLSAFLLTASQQVWAQGETPKEEKKEVQEIIIRKKGDKDNKLSIEFKEGEVLINGKSIVEFKDDEISINNKKLVEINGNKMRFFGDHNNGFEMDFGNFERDIERAFAFSDKSAAFLGVSTSGDKDGAKVNEVTKESAADKAGLKQGDIITRLGDKKIEDPAQLSEAVAAYKPKDEVKIGYKRDGKEKTTKATLGQRGFSKTRSLSITGPDGKLRSFTVPDVVVEGKPMAPRSFNWDRNNFDKEVILAQGFGRPRLGIKIQDTEEANGVKVLEVEKDSPADKAGLKQGDIITAVAGNAVKNTDEARDHLSSNAQKSAYTISGSRNGTAMSFEIKIPKKLKTANL